MAKFYVSVPEVWIQQVLVEAETAEDAISMAKNGDGETLDDQLEYSHTIDDDDMYNAHKAIV